MRAVFSSWLVAVTITVASSNADDWPQWLGPQRDSVWRERGVLARFPAEGLKVRWRAAVALGYAGPAVADGRVYVIDYQRSSGEFRNNPGGRERLEGKERVLCFDATSGELRWKHQYDRPYHVSYPGGPRCTPTVAGGRVFALGAEGNLWCLDAQTGRVLWSVDFVKDYGAQTPFYGVAAHPLVAGDLVYCVVGGQNKVAVAFDVRTGREVWHALSAGEPGYCPPTLIEHAGTPQLLIWHGEAINSLHPRTGAVYWTVPLKPRFGMAIVAPRKLGGHLLVTGYGEGAMLRLRDSRPDAEVAWRCHPKTGIFCATSTPFLEDGMIYGCDIETGALMGVRIEDGQRLWETHKPTIGGAQSGRYGTAFLVKHEDRFFLFSETGDLILAKLSRSGYEELGRFHVLEPTNHTFGRRVVWSHPAFAGRCLFARNDKELVCVSLAASP